MKKTGVTTEAQLGFDFEAAAQEAAPLLHCQTAEVVDFAAYAHAKNSARAQATHSVTERLLKEARQLTW